MPDDMHPQDAAKVFAEFVAAINAHDLEALSLLMTADHLFMDSLGNRVRGAAPMLAGWRGYFAMCPDYRIVIDTVMTDENNVIATGEASGTIDATAWSTPAAWKASILRGRLAEWRVFADNKPVYEILARRAGQQHGQD